MSFDDISSFIVQYWLILFPLFLVTGAGIFSFASTKLEDRAERKRDNGNAN